MTKQHQDPIPAQRLHDELREIEMIDRVLKRMDERLSARREPMSGGWWLVPAIVLGAGLWVAIIMTALNL